MFEHQEEETDERSRLARRLARMPNVQVSDAIPDVIAAMRGRRVGAVKLVSSWGSVIGVLVDEDLVAGWAIGLGTVGDLRGSVRDLSSRMELTRFLGPGRICSCPNGHTIRDPRAKPGMKCPAAGCGQNLTRCG